jgi:hypothetical protein
MTGRYGDLRRVQLGELHPAARCARCDARARAVELRQTTLAATKGRAVLCVDLVACSRRRYALTAWPPLSTSTRRPR